jgi:hypothetical protein
MRTTLDIEDDVLQAVKELARQEGSTAGQIISKLARRSLTASSIVETGKLVIRNGVPVYPARGEVVTLQHVRELMDQDGI